MLQKILSKIDPLQSTVILIIALIGLAVNYSMTYSLTNPELGAGSFEKQIVFVALGFLLYITFSVLDITWLKQRLVIFFLLISNFIILISALRFAPVIAGVRRWFLIGPIQIQVSEISKVILIILSAYFLSHFFENKLFSKLKTRIDIFKNVAILLGINIASFVLIALEPSLGIAALILLSQFFVIIHFWPYKKSLIFLALVTSFLTIGIYIFQNSYLNNVELIAMILGFLIFIFIIFRVLRISKVILFLAIIIGLVLLPSLQYGYNNILNDYQRQRIVAFITPQDVSKDSVYQQTQARIAIQTGGIFGMGYLQGSQTKSVNHIPNLPYAYTDFVYAGFSEEFGIVGSVVLLSLFVVLFLRILQIGQGVEDNFFSIMIFGIGVMFIVQSIVHVAINLGLIANTGIPLPLISYGGSVNLIYFVMFGIVNAIKNVTEIKSFGK